MELIDWIVAGCFFLGGWLLNRHLRTMREELKRIRQASEGLRDLYYNNH